MARPPRLVTFPGQGVLFWWQQGAVSALRPHLPFGSPDLHLSGASAGACTAVLAACGVRTPDVLDAAEALAARARVFERPLGLAGVWGSLLREWFDELLPADAAARCDGRVHLALLKLPWLERDTASAHRSRAELVDAALASAHVPLFMDGALCARYRGAYCIDAGVGMSPRQLLPPALLPVAERGSTAAAVLSVCYSDDPALAALRRSELLLARSPAALRELVARGEAFGNAVYVPAVRAGRAPLVQVCGGALPPLSWLRGASRARAGGGLAAAAARASAAEAAAPAHQPAGHEPRRGEQTRTMA